MSEQCEFLEQLRMEMDVTYISDLKLLAKKEKHFQIFFLERILKETDMRLDEIKDAVMYLCGKKLSSGTIELCREEIKKLLREDNVSISLDKSRGQSTYGLKS